MTRRELLKVANAVALGTLPGTFSVVSAEAAPVLAILEFDDSVSMVQAERLKDQFQQALKDFPPFDRVKLLVLGKAARLTFFDAQGEICTKEIVREFGRAYSVK